MIKVIKNPLLSWEPAVITVFAHAPCDQKHVNRVHEVVQDALNRRDGLKQCKCFQTFLDVSLHGPNEIRVLCQWLCPICLPKIFEELEKNVPRLRRFELGIAQKVDPSKTNFLSIPAKKVLLENGEQLFVQKFSISLRAITVGEFSAFCSDAQYKTVAEEQHRNATYRSNAALRDFSVAAGLNKAATHLSFEDAQAYCKWSGVRLPTEAEFFAASLWDDEVQTSYDPVTEEKIRNLLANGKLPIFAGTSITSTIVNDSVVMRSGPKYTREKGWQLEENYQRHLRSEDYFDATTTFHVCES